MRPRLPADAVAQACAKDECQAHQLAYETKLVRTLPGRISRVRLDLSRDQALYDVDEVEDPVKAGRLRRVILKHGVEVVRAEAYL